MTTNYEELQVRIVTNLIKLRQDKNITIKELSKKAGVSYTVLYDMEIRLIIPKLETLVKICNVYNITFQELISNVYTNTESLSLKDYLLFNGLTRKEIDMAESYINFIKSNR